MGNKRRKGTKHPENIKRKISESLKGMFSKEKNPNWKGGITNALKVIRYSDEYFNWRDIIFKRDNFECRICKKESNGDLNAHHILSFAVYPDIRFDKNNGITVCQKCHKLLHKIFGRECKIISQKIWIQQIVNYAEVRGISFRLKKNLLNIYHGDLIQDRPEVGV